MFKNILKGILPFALVFVAIIAVNKGCDKIRENTKEKSELRLQLLNSKANEAAALLDLNAAMDSIGSLNATVFEVKGNDDIPQRVKYITKYVGDSQVVARLQNKYIEVVDSVNTERLKLVKQNRLLTAYCDSLSTLEQTIDSLSNTTINWPIVINSPDNDPWYTLEVEVYPDYSNIDLSVVEDFNIVHQQYKKGIWPFRKKQYQVVVSSKNPYKVNEKAQVYIIK